MIWLLIQSAAQLMFGAVLGAILAELLIGYGAGRKWGAK